MKQSPPDMMNDSAKVKELHSTAPSGDAPETGDPHDQKRASELQATASKTGRDDSWHHRLQKWKPSLPGFIIGVLGWRAASDLNFNTLIPVIPGGLAWLLVGLLCAVLCRTRLSGAIWGFFGFISAVILIVGCTPLIYGPARSLVRQDPLQKCEAVVALSSEIRSDGLPDQPGHNRLMHALELIRQGYARRLVVTRLPAPHRSVVPAVQKQMRDLGFTAPVEEVGPVTSTHDEAVKVAQLVRLRYWTSVIVVTNPLHSRRAGATFTRAGVRAVVHPCVELQYDLTDLTSVSGRLSAFRDWLREVIGWQTYRLRGWV